MWTERTPFFEQFYRKAMLLSPVKKVSDESHTSYRSPFEGINVVTELTVKYNYYSVKHTITSSIACIAYSCGFACSFDRFEIPIIFETLSKMIGIFYLPFARSGRAGTHLPDNPAEPRGAYGGHPGDGRMGRPQLAKLFCPISYSSH